MLYATPRTQCGIVESNPSSMKSLSHTARTLLALFLAIAIPANPQQSATQQLPPQLDDPANLTGERVSPQDPADTLPINHGALALQQLLRKLRTRASFMLIVAHPDDEDGGMLTYLSRGQGARVAMLTLNRGEGGQNLMSADFDDALGLIRTQELLAADRYMAVDQFFGTEVDFGFSKTKEEAFAKWTHERVLYDAVRAVRLYRPLVIASVFIGEPIRRPRPAPGLRRDRAGGLQRRRRPQRLPRPDRRRPPALAAAQGLRPRPLRPHRRPGHVRLRHRPVHPRALHQLRNRKSYQPPSPPPTSSSPKATPTRSSAA